MTFLASACSKTLLKLQKSHFEYQKQIIMARINAVSREIDYVAAQYNSADSSQAGQLEKDPYYLELKRQSETYETQSSTYDDEISLLNEEITALDNLTKNGIKSSCSLTLSGGS